MFSVEPLGSVSHQKAFFGLPENLYGFFALYENLYGFSRKPLGV
jgi:hypothetical protein